MRDFAAVLAIAGAVACGASGSSDVDGGADGGSDSGAADVGPPPDGAVVPPSATCTSPIAAADVSSPTTTLSTCTEDAFDAALQKGGVITFACGTQTITMTKEHALRTDIDTIIDGGGKITLDGANQTRILALRHLDYRKNTTTVTLQHLTMRGGKGSGTAIPSAPAPCSQGTDTDGGGGAIWVRDAKLHVIDVTFVQNQGAALGPDVGGGALYALGSLEVIISGSAFASNQASNGGHVGMLNSDFSVYNTTFTDGVALGSGGNDIDKSKCSTNGGEVGSGGSAGAIFVDGGDGTTVTVCGALFQNNKANVLAGAMFRTPDGAQQKTTFDRCTFDGNTVATGGGGALYMHNSLLEIFSSTFSNNSALGSGGIQGDSSIIDFRSSTFSGNHATAKLGGAMSLFNATTGTINGCTFAGNLADAGSGLFAAAIAGAPKLTITNSIFDANTDKDCGAPMACQLDGASSGATTFQWPQNHVVCASADSPCAPGGTTFADPLLGALADNGGPTKTLLPQSTSPAAGAGKACLPFDQRGNARKTPDGCTAGAVELP